MSQLQVLLRMVEKLEGAGIPYMISGSVASGVHGRPRSTYDVDVIIDPSSEQLKRFIRLVAEEAYVSREAALAALRNRSMFNVIDDTTGWKLDFIIRKDRTYSRVEFRRRAPQEIDGATFYFVAPEDAILSKLEWAKKTDSGRQLEDALGVTIAQAGSLDEAYLREWADRLGVLDLLDKVLSDAKNLMRDGDDQRLI